MKPNEPAGTGSSLGRSETQQQQTFNNKSHVNTPVFVGSQVKAPPFTRWGLFY
jgi:hypothetical protein